MHAAWRITIQMRVMTCHITVIWCYEHSPQCMIVTDMYFKA